ncbi:tetratricopeptide repeat protein [Kiritimatiellaeota bacterium B1221]|nr:tetratricopeptide repeat protein [Kiritimatiellaeota bacterium B1221]
MNKYVQRMSAGLLIAAGTSLLAQSPPPGAGDTGRILEPPSEPVKVKSWMDQDEARQYKIQGTEIFTYPDILECGQQLENLSAPAGARIVIPLEVGDKLIRLGLAMSGGQGDADMYLSQGEVPGLHSYQYRPYVNGNIEEIQLEDPGAGRWFLMVHAYRAFSGVSIALNCVESREEVLNTEFTPDQDIELALYYELSLQQTTNEVRNTALQSQLLNKQGRDAFDAGQYDEALEAWNQWVNLEPRNPRPVALVGDLYLRTEDLENAVSYYRKSLELQPGQIGLMSRLSSLLDVKMGDSEAAKEMLNHFARLFPTSSGVALTQAEWLIRRNRYEEAVEIIETVVEMDPENLKAMSIMHPLLRDQDERYANMLRMLEVGQLPGREASLGYTIKDDGLLTRPESWVLMDFIYRMAGESPSAEQRILFESLLPRDTITVEDFRIGRLSSNWISSHQEVFEEGGSMVLSADATQAEAFLRLKRSDSMHNGFVEAWIDDSQGYFWMYARRGQGNMVRFGFADNGQLYLQVWMNDRLINNQTRIWSRLPGDAVLRLELQGDGAMGYINGEKAFSSPVTIPESMGLGWWGIAPWSAKLGTASVTVSKVSGGPLPVRLGLIPHEELSRPSENKVGGLSQKLTGLASELSTLAPEWFTQDDRGDLTRLKFEEDEELRLMSRYYRMRLLPMLRVRSYRALDLEALGKIALEQRLDGFTLLVERMPEPEWLEQAQRMVMKSGITLHFILLDNKTGKASFRELCGNIGVFAGPRRVKTLSLEYASRLSPTLFEDAGPDTVIYLDNTPEMEKR